MNRNLKEYKEFIDNEMLLILGQMDKATLIFDHLYLVSAAFIRPPTLFSLFLLILLYNDEQIASPSAHPIPKFLLIYLELIIKK